MSVRTTPAGGESAAGVLAAAQFGDVAALAAPDGRGCEPTAGFRDGAPVRCVRLYVGERLHGSVRSFVTMAYRPDLSDHCAVHARFDLAVAS
jgi:hypothetical protein